MIKEFPDKAEGHRLMGLYLSREGKFDEAVTSLSKSIRIQPDLETYYLLGLAYYYLGNLEMAVTQFQTVLDYSPGFVQARVMQGEIFLRQGRGAEALVVADKMLETAPRIFAPTPSRATPCCCRASPRSRGSFTGRRPPWRPPITACCSRTAC
jgi:tetratricopeptide (TPR) repeat protein